MRYSGTRRRCGSSALVALALVAAGCGGLRSEQRSLIPQWERQAAELGHADVRYENVKSPGLATALGFLPGGGGFYTGRSGLGVAGLLTWPLSLAWEPVTAYGSAQQYNFWKLRDRMIEVALEATEREERELEGAVIDGQLTEGAYRVRRDRLARCANTLQSELGRRRANDAPSAINRCLSSPPAVGTGTASR